jgi:hypothetical protein
MHRHTRHLHRRALSSLKGKVKAQLHNLRTIGDVSFGSDLSGFIGELNNGPSRMIGRLSKNLNHGPHVPTMQASLRLID